MRKVNVSAVRERREKSPKGKYRAYVKEISIALGREPRSLDLARRHPFDLAVVRLPPRAAACPYHAHSAQWELYVILAGVGTVRHARGTTKVNAGDAFLFGPGEAHQISNQSKEQLVYYVVADNPVGTSCYYPDSGKWMVGQPSPRTVLKGRKTDYFEGEE